MPCRKVVARWYRPKPVLMIVVAVGEVRYTRRDVQEMCPSEPFHSKETSPWLFII